MATTQPTQTAPVPRVVAPQPIGYGNLLYPTQGQIQPDPFGGRFGNNPGLLSYLIASNQPQWANPTAPAPGTPTTPVTPAPTPTPTPGGTGQPPAGGWTPQPTNPNQPIYRNDNHGGGGGAFGGGNAQAAYDASQRNLATNPSLADSALFGSSFAGPMGILGLMGQLGLSQFGIGSNPFNINGDMTLSPAQQASIASALQGIPENAPAVVKANMLNNAIAAARAQSNNIGNAPGQRSAITGGILGGYNSAGNRGPAGAAGMGGGDRGAGTQGSPGGSPGGGLGGGYRL